MEVLKRLPSDSQKTKFRYPPPVVKKRRKTHSPECKHDEQRKTKDRESTTPKRQERKTEVSSPPRQALNLRRRRTVAPIHKVKPPSEPAIKPEPPKSELALPAPQLPPNLPLRVSQKKKPQREKQVVLHQTIRRDLVGHDSVAALTQPLLEARIEDVGGWRLAKSEQDSKEQRRPPSTTTLHTKVSLNRIRELTPPPLSMTVPSPALIHWGPFVEANKRWKARTISQKKREPPSPKRRRVLHSPKKKEVPLVSQTAIQHLAEAVTNITLEDRNTGEKHTYPVYRDKDVYGEDALPILYDEEEEDEEDDGSDDQPTTREQWESGVARNRKLVTGAMKHLWELAELKPSHLSVASRLERLHNLAQRRKKKLLVV